MPGCVHCHWAPVPPAALPPWGLGHEPPHARHAGSCARCCWRAGGVARLRTRDCLRKRCALHAGTPPELMAVPTHFFKVWVAGHMSGACARHADWQRARCTHGISALLALTGCAGRPAWGQGGGWRLCCSQPGGGPRGAADLVHGAAHRARVRGWWVGSWASALSTALPPCPAPAHRWRRREPSLAPHAHAGLRFFPGYLDDARRDALDETGALVLHARNGRTPGGSNSCPCAAPCPPPRSAGLPATGAHAAQAPQAWGSAAVAAAPAGWSHAACRYTRAWWAAGGQASDR